MIIYSVTVTIEAAIESEWLDWMRQVHVPDVLRTGCFAEATIYKLIEPKSDDPTYVIQPRSIWRVRSFNATATALPPRCRRNIAIASAGVFALLGRFWRECEYEAVRGALALYPLPPLMDANEHQ